MPLAQIVFKTLEKDPNSVEFGGQMGFKKLYPVSQELMLQGRCEHRRAESHLAMTRVSRAI